MNPITERSQVTDEILEHAFAIVEGYYLDEPINRFDFIDRLESWSGLDFGSKVDSPAITFIIRKARVHRREINS
jgi:hypothetical protein